MIWAAVRPFVFSPWTWVAGLSLALVAGAWIWVSSAIADAGAAGFANGFATSQALNRIQVDLARAQSRLNFAVAAAALVILALASGEKAWKVLLTLI